jgi:hypothetical protein
MLPALEGFSDNNPPSQEPVMLKNAYERTGKIRYGLAAMLLGLPLPIVLIAFLIGGCH